jgi:hypothetical protein
MILAVKWMVIYHEACVMVILVLLILVKASDESLQNLLTLSKRQQLLRGNKRSTWG